MKHPANRNSKGVRQNRGGSLRYGAISQEKPGLIDKSGQLRDLSAHVKDLNGEAYAPGSLAKLAALDTAKLPAVDGEPRLGAPVTGISKFVAIGLNYIDHAKETGNPIPPEPIFFLKANTALSGPNDNVEKPRLDQARLGSRNRRHHRHPRQIRLRGRRAQSRRRLLRLQRRSPSAISRSSVRGSGPRASRMTPSVRSVRGSSPRTRNSGRTRNCRCGSTSTASAARGDRPRP